MFVRTTLAVVLAAAATVSAPRVVTFGSMRQLVREGDATPKVVLADVLKRPHAHGLGSISGLRGEIAIVDGTAWLSYPSATAGAAPTVIASTDSRERAGFLVATHVDPTQWRRVAVGEALSADNLEAVLGKLVAQHGLGGADVPFRIDGKFSTLTLAIVDGRKLPPGATLPDAMKQANQLQTETGVDATLVGFFAATSDERFTHPGTRVHVHAVVPARRATGHARAFSVAPGATLWLPTQGAHAAAP
jgi:alpha-acetolactate decarboxylase